MMRVPNLAPGTETSMPSNMPARLREYMALERRRAGDDSSPAFTIPGRIAGIPFVFRFA